MHHSNTSDHQTFLEMLNTIANYLHLLLDIIQFLASLQDNSIYIKNVINDNNDYNYSSEDENTQMLKVTNACFVVIRYVLNILFYFNIYIYAYFIV